MSVIVFTLIGWCILNAWESNEDEDVWQNSLVVLRRTRVILFECVKGLNPFHICRVPQHDHFTLSDQLGEVRV